MTRGDRDAGSVLVVVSARDSVRLYTPNAIWRLRVWREQSMDAETLAKTVASRLSL
jgi:hypothetical protein